MAFRTIPIHHHGPGRNSADTSRRIPFLYGTGPNNTSVNHWVPLFGGPERNTTGTGSLVTFHHGPERNNTRTNLRAADTWPATRPLTGVGDLGPDNILHFTYSDDEDIGKNVIDDKVTPTPHPGHSDLLKVLNTDTHYWENARAHHTDKFNHVQEGHLVIRRGQAFDLTISFNKEFNVNTNDIRFTFETGDKPVPGKGTLLIFSLTSVGTWNARISKIVGNDVTCTILTDSKCIVGKWILNIECIKKKSDSRSLNRNTKVQIPLFILFNPWNKEDTVYFANTKQLSEYVLNDSGCIFSGNYKQIGAKPWFFGQFEDDVLEATIYCLDKASNFRKGTSLGDPVYVSRAISKIVNSNDDRGVIVGNWSGEYTDGKSPLSWIGSVAILRQYLRSQAPVKYGQCFVFSGLVTTICRSLGIPCRCVTNFASAHDTDASVTIDVHWGTKTDGDDGTPLDHLNTDSIWNFHVWNDVWMKRKDLPVGHDGWQVLDATPQEKSHGIFQCGPAPLVAILDGQCNIPYDVPFIFAEVNADKVHWGQSTEGAWKVIDLETSSVGKKISTKVPDGLPIPAQLSDCEGFREDITHMYKHEEDSDRERMAVVNAARTTTTGNRQVYNRGNTDIKVEFYNKDHVMIGSNFDYVFTVENTSRVTKTISGKIICDVITYTGKKLGTCKESRFELTLGPREKKTIAMRLTSAEYLRHVTEVAMMKLSVIARVRETGQVLAMQDDFRLRTPDLKLKVLTKSPRARSQLILRVRLNNPLRVRLTNCQVSVEGAGVEQLNMFKLGDILPLQTFKTNLEIRPLRKGMKQIFATLECDQLHDVKGVADVWIR